MTNSNARIAPVRPSGITFLAIVNYIACGVTLIFWALVFFGRLVPTPGSLQSEPERANAAVTYGFMLGDRALLRPAAAARGRRAVAAPRLGLARGPDGQRAVDLLDDDHPAAGFLLPLVARARCSSCRSPHLRCGPSPTCGTSGGRSEWSADTRVMGRAGPRGPASRPGSCRMSPAQVVQEWVRRFNAGRY